MNLIKNNPITSRDIDVAEMIFGKDIGTIKGKSKRVKRMHVPEDYIAIPPELINAQKNVTLCLDGMFVNGMPFLTTVSRRIIYRTAQQLLARNSTSLLQGIKNVVKVYQEAGFVVARIHADNEFKPLLDEIKNEIDSKLYVANPGEHVPEAENNNKVQKERIRTCFHRLPYKTMPSLMLEMMVMKSAAQLNYFAPKDGVSREYTPRMILHQRGLEYAKHCAIPFGTYVIAYQDNDPKNTVKSRGLDSIYLRPSAESEGGHEVMSLETGRLVTRGIVHKQPFTPQVIEAVHQLARKEGMPEGLKVVTKAGVILYDSALTAGVDYDPNQTNYEEQDDDYSEEVEEEDDDQLDEEEYDVVDAVELEELEAEAKADWDVQDIQEEEVDPQDDDEDSSESESESESEDEDEVDEENEEQLPPTRTRKAPDKFGEWTFFGTNNVEYQEYDESEARIIAMCMAHYNDIARNPNHKSHSFIQTYSLQKGLKKFGERGRDAAMGEISQLHDRIVFWPRHKKDLTPEELEKIMESLIFLAEKRDGRVKARTCANGSVQRDYISKEESASPTVSTEAVLLTGVVDAKEGRDVMISVIPNAFVQTGAEKPSSGECIMMKIQGPMVDMLCELDPMLYKPYVIYENGKKTLYVEVLKALYGMMQASLWFYKKFCKDLQQEGYKMNPYDPCVANKMINGKQHTVTWHVDDLKSSHVDTKINDDFHQWLEKMYGDPKIGKVKSSRGKIHDYLAMTLDYTTPGVLKVDMTDYVKGIVNEFPYPLQDQKYPWTAGLYTVNEDSPKLSQEKKELFHTFVAKVLFVSKRSRADINPAIAYLTTRVRDPTEEDWKKLVKMLGFLKRTQDDIPHLKADSLNIIKWSLDASFAVHPDMRSHTGAIMSLGSGAIQSISTKQKINTRSSTEAELVSFDDIINKVMWTKLFMEAQGYYIERNMVYRDNQSAMKLELNGKASSSKRTRHFNIGKASSSKRTRHFNIKYFYVTNLIKRGDIQTQFCSTEDMTADYNTKPLLGEKFHRFRSEIMGWN